MTEISAREMYRKGKQILDSSSYDCNGELDARVLLLHSLGMTTEQFYAHGDEIFLNDRQIEDFETVLRKRIGRLPVAYITGKKEFMGIEFVVSPSVLIPRPATESLVERALEIAGKAGWDNPMVADVGCGSGNISISFAFYHRKARIFAVDCSIPALRVARKNIEIIDKAYPDKSIFHRVHILVGDMFEPLPPEHKGKFNLILSNPPYVTQEEWENLMDGVKLYEPREALCPLCPPDMLYDRLARESREYLSDGGWLLVEIGSTQGEMVKKVFDEQGFKDIFIDHDLEGFDRVVAGRK